MLSGESGNAVYRGSWRECIFGHAFEDGRKRDVCAGAEGGIEMKILGLDSSGLVAGVAVAEDGELNIR